MKNYSQLTLLQRYELERLLSDNVSKSTIATQLNIHASTIYRELKRNSDQCNNRYYVSLAHRKSEHRHANKPKQDRFTASIKNDVRTT